MIRVITLCFAALMLASCASQPAADMRTAFTVISGQPPAGRGRVFIFAGNTFVGDSVQPYLNSFDIFVDGVLVGGVNSGEVMGVDLPAGSHLIVRKTKTVWGFSTDPVGVNLNLYSGQKRYLAVDRYMAGVQLTSIAIATYRSRIVGAAVSMQSVASQRAPGDYLEERTDGPQIVASSTVVMPNQQALSILTTH